MTHLVQFSTMNWVQLISSVPWTPGPSNYFYSKTMYFHTPLAIWLLCCAFES